MGLNHVRSLNHPFGDLDLVQNNYHQGLLIYKRKPDANVTPEVSFNDYRMMTRFSVKFTHQPLVKVMKNDGQFAAETAEEQTHLVVFEHIYRDVDEELVISINKIDEIFDYTVYNDWKLVDFDGFFDGNSFNRPANKVVLEDLRN